MTLRAGVKAELLAYGEASGFANLNDTATTILAEHFGLKYEPLGTASRARRDSDYVCWSVPISLRDRINDRLRTENRRRRRSGAGALNRDDYLNDIFRSELDARRSAVA